jgi:hypothetical protein
MERRGIAEIGGAALLSGVFASVTLVFIVGYVDWVLVVGLTAGAALAAAANYRARTRHADSVATEAPEVTADNYEEYTPLKAGDGGTEGHEESDRPE